MNTISRILPGFFINKLYIILFFFNTQEDWFGIIIGLSLSHQTK